MRKIVQFTLFFLFFNLRPQEAAIEKDKIVLSFRSSDGVIIPVEASIADNIRAFKDILETVEDGSREPFDLLMVSKNTWDIILLLMKSLKDEVEKFDQKFDSKGYQREFFYNISNVFKKIFKSKNIDQMIQVATAMDFLQPSITFTQKDGEEKTYYFYDDLLERLSSRITDSPLSKGLEILERIDNSTLLDSLKGLFLKDLFKYQCGLIKYNKYVKAHNIEDEVFEKEQFVIDYLVESNNQRWIEYNKKSSTIFFKNSLGEEAYSCVFPDEVKLAAVFYYKPNCLLYIDTANRKVSLVEAQIDENKKIIPVKTHHECVGFLTSYAACKKDNIYIFAVRGLDKSFVGYCNFKQEHKGNLEYPSAETLLVAFNKLGTKFIVSNHDGLACLYSINLDYKEEKIGVEDSFSLNIDKFINFPTKNIRNLSFGEDDNFLAISSGKISGALTIFDIKSNQLVGSPFSIGYNLFGNKIDFSDKYCKVFLSDGSVQYYLTPGLIEDTMKKSFTADDALFIHFSEHKRVNKSKKEVKKYFHFFMANNGQNASAIFSPFEDHDKALKDYNEAHLSKTREKIKEERLALFASLERKKTIEESGLKLKAHNVLDEDEDYYSEKRERKN